MTVDIVSQIFSRLDRELWLITARAGDRQSGLIATNVSGASLVPSIPRITVGLAKHHFTHELIDESRAFCMHLLHESHIDWVWRFGIHSGRLADKLQGLATHTSTTGSPILTGAPAWLDCRVETAMDTGDRTVYLAEVLDAHAEPAVEPLTFKRLLQLAPADKLQELKLDREHDIELDRAAILEWRRKQEIKNSQGTA
jgi:flavin reductase (DIM6/NTAB) family NADH-FMN oxidoreductase RutF